MSTAITHSNAHQPPPQVKCPLCEVGRDWEEFLLAPGGTTLSAFCGTCRTTKKGQVRSIQSAIAGSRGRVPQEVPAIARAELKRHLHQTLNQLIATRGQLGKEGMLMAEGYAQQLQNLPNRIAMIISQTCAEAGDAFEVADDEALGKIRDLLLELDQEIIERAKKRRASWKGNTPSRKKERLARAKT